MSLFKSSILKKHLASQDHSQVLAAYGVFLTFFHYPIIRENRLIQSKFRLDKPSTKLQNWPSLEFKGFLGELGKAKVKMSLSEEAEWMAYFTEQKQKALTFNPKSPASTAKSISWCMI